ncbi:MAG: GGDEF domain-containing protein [Candidatus Pacearchaeota archaeon]
MLKKTKKFQRSIHLFVISLIVAAVLFASFSYISIKSNVNVITAAVETIKSVLSDSISATYEKIETSLASMYKFVILELLILAGAVVASLFAINYLLSIYFHISNISLADELTGIYNRRALYQMLDKEIKRARRFKHPLTIAMMDIDFFKVYNDKNGHLAGDELLKKITKLIQGKIREVDTLGRYGGEEFLIIMPETSHESAVRAAERIRKSVQDTHFKGEETQPKGQITVSIGVATFHGEYKGRAHMIGIADQLLYKAKEGGRNQLMKAYHLALPKKSKK